MLTNNQTLEIIIVGLVSRCFDEKDTFYFLTLSDSLFIFNRVYVFSVNPLFILD